MFAIVQKNSELIVYVNVCEFLSFGPLQLCFVIDSRYMSNDESHYWVSVFD